MSIRKRVWVDRKGEKKTAWVCNYTDTKGVRRLKTFAKKKDADAFGATAAVEVREGSHVADAASVTIETAGRMWIASCEGNGLERSTLAQYRQHLDLHIIPLTGSSLLSRFTMPHVRAFEDDLRNAGRSPAMVRKVMVSLGSLLADAQDRGLVARNVVRDKSRRQQRGKDRIEKRHKGRLKVGVDIPTREEVKAIVGALTGRWRPLLLLAIFAGLRASELRGLRWQDVDLDKREVHVRQRADRFNDLGSPKSLESERTVPVPPLVINAMKEWRLGYGRPVIGRDEEGKPIREDARPSHLVFANGVGKVESLANIINRGLVPTQLAAGVTVTTAKLDMDGKPLTSAKYTGLHALRHFFASWLINRPQEGGMGMPLKVVQERMGHSTITITADTYGHLFPRGDDADELAAGEIALLG